MSSRQISQTAMFSVGNDLIFLLVSFTREDLLVFFTNVIYK